MDGVLILGKKDLGDDYDKGLKWAADCILTATECAKTVKFESSLYTGVLCNTKAEMDAFGWIRLNFDYWKDNRNR